MKQFACLLIFCLVFLHLEAQSTFKIGINNNIGIAQQPYHTWSNNNETIFENGSDYSTGLILEKSINRLFFRTGLSYRFTDFNNMNRRLALYTIPNPNLNHGYIIAPRLTDQSFHQASLPLVVGFQLVDGKKIKIGWLTEMAINITFSKKETYKGYYGHPLLEPIEPTESTYEHQGNDWRLQNINLQTGISIQYPIGENWLIFCQPMVSVVEYKTANDISKGVGQENFMLNDAQFLSFKNFGVGFGVFRILSK